MHTKEYTSKVEEQTPRLDKLDHLTILDFKIICLSTLNYF